MINLGACSRENRIPDSEKQTQQSETQNNISSPFILFVKETSEYHVLSLYVKEETPVGLILNQSKHHFTNVSGNDNQIVLSCNDIESRKNLTYMLVLSLCDSDSKYLCTYTFRDVKLSENACIDLTDVDNGTIKISVDQEETAYIGCLSSIG